MPLTNRKLTKNLKPFIVSVIFSICFLLWGPPSHYSTADIPSLFVSSIISYYSVFVSVVWTVWVVGFVYCSEPWMLGAVKVQLLDASGQQNIAENHSSLKRVFFPSIYASQPSRTAAVVSHSGWVWMLDCQFWKVTEVVGPSIRWWKGSGGGGFCRILSILVLW